MQCWETDRARSQLESHNYKINFCFSYFLACESIQQWMWCLCWQESDKSNGNLLTPSSCNDASSSSAVTRGRRCGVGSSHPGMMSGGDLIVTSSIDENSEFVDEDNVLSEIIVSSFLFFTLFILQILENIWLNFYFTGSLFEL